jgi:hypothetical protein
MQTFDPPQSDQDFFNKAWKWMITDLNPRCTNNGSCSYRGTAKGENQIRSCVIGAFIPDDHIGDFNMLRGIGELLNPSSPDYCEKLAVLFKHVTIDLLRQVQLVHDTSPFPANRRGRMKIIAHQFNLVIPGPLI